MPVQLPIKPAQTARLDLIKVAAELELPRTGTEAHLLLSLIVYELIDAAGGSDPAA